MKNVIAVSIATAAMLGAQLAFAENAAGLYQGKPSIYAGFGGGITASSDFCDEDADVTLTSCDDADLNLKAFGGFRAHQNLAIEASVIRLGEFTASARVFGVPVTGSAEASTVNLQALGIMPVNDRAELFGKLGLSLWSVDAVAITRSGSVSADARGTDIVIGAGANIVLTDKLSLRFDWDLYPNIGDKDETGEVSLMTAAAGLQFNF